MGWELISYKPALEFANDLGYDLVALGIKPFSLEWAIFPAGMREEAKAAAETPGFKSLNFITENRASNGTIQSVWANCQVNFTQNFWVPAPDHTCWEWYGYKDVRNYPQGPVLTPEQGPCPRIPGSGDDDNGRRLSSDEPEPEVSTCSL